MNRPEPGLSTPADSGSSGFQGHRLDRLLTVDAMRSVAALSVLLIHVGYIGGQRWLAPFSFLAVDLFYMISGFVIGYAFEARLLAGMGWRRFMAIRIVRLYPAILLGLALGLVAAALVRHVGYRVGWQFIGHLLLIPDLRGWALFPLNGAFWTLFFEVLLNGVHAAAVRQLSTRRLALFALASGLAWGALAWSIGDWGTGWSGGMPFVGGLARVSWGYSVGLLLYRLSSSGRLTVPRTPALLPAGLAALLLIAPPLGPFWLRVVPSVFLVLPLLILLAASAEMPRRARALSEWFAALSYPLYAVHLPFLLIARSLIGPFDAAATAAVTLGCIAFAAAAAGFYDAPARKWLAAKLLRGNGSQGAGGRQREETLYDSCSIVERPGAFFAGTWRDFRRSGPIAWRLFRSELRARRRQSLLGHAWLVMPAAATAVVCTYFQKQGIVSLGATPLPYPLFVLSGVLLWQTFVDGVNAPLQQLNAMRQLITRSRVPHEAVVAVGAASALLNGALRLAVLLLALPFFKVAPSTSLLLLPIGFAALVLLGLAAGVAIAPFGLLYGDVARALPLAILFWFFLTPVVYPIHAGVAWLRFNPVGLLIETSRSWLLGPSQTSWLIAVVLASAIALAAAMLLYRAAQPHLVARLG